MIQVCEEHHNNDGVAFWQWVLHVLDLAGLEFMSDEDGTTIFNETQPNRILSIPAKEVLMLQWRHPYFLKLFTFIDVTTGIEEMIFQKTGKAALKRIRSQRISSWGPPTGRPVAFYAPVYLKNLTIPQKASLKMDEAEFLLRSFEGYLDG